MANEFKIKKGLIVTGASGGTVVDIQGSQGQLFSVTDDLSGSIFAVSDISGVPILDVNSSGVSYFDGTVGIGTNSPGKKLEVKSDITYDGIQISGSSIPTLAIIDTTNNAKLVAYARDSDATIGTETNHTLTINTNNTTALTIDTSQNATFAGNINLPTAKYLRFTSAASGSSGTVLFGNTTGTAGDLIFKRNSDSASMFKITGSGNAEVTGKGTSAATITSDGSSTLTTKGYVDGLITGATIYRGTWDPDITANSGNGTPDLSTVTQTSGYYYICSDIGTAHPNGTTGSPAVPCEPNSWAVGDWVIWNDDVPDCPGTGTGAWQKIDNTSVLSGVGTGQTVALWEGAGSVTDSETLGNAPITVSGNDTTFAGGASIATDAGLVATAPIFNSNTGSRVMYLRGNNIVQFQNTAGANKWEVVGRDGQYYVYKNDGTGSGMKYQIDGSGNHNFTGVVTLASGALNLSGTGRIQGVDTVTDNTDAANKLYVDNAVAAVPIGDYLPLAGGTMDADSLIGGSGTLELGGVGVTNLLFDSDGTNIMRIVKASATLKFAEIISDADEVRLRIRDGMDIYYDDTAATNYMKFEAIGVNKTEFTTSAFEVVGIGSSSGETLFTAEGGGAVTLYHADVLQLETTTTGISTNTIDATVAAGSAGNFVVMDGTRLSYRTAAEVLSDIGGAPATGGPYLPVANPTFTGALTGPYADLDYIQLTAANPGILMKETDTTDKNWDIQVNSGNLKFYEVNDARSVFSEKVTFKAGGNVGIGVTNPGRKLSVAGSIELTGSDMTLNTTSAAIRRGTAGQMFLDAPGDVTVTIDSNSNNTDRVFNVRKDTGSELFRIQENGNVGIGNTNPQAKLHIGASLNSMPANTSIAMNGGTTLRFTGGGDGNSDYGAYIAGVTVGSIRTLQLGSRNLSTDELAMTLSQGKVGIGTTTPLAKLDIQGTQGQLFSVTDNLTGSNIFAVSDISGVPILQCGVDYGYGNVSIDMSFNNGYTLNVGSTGNGSIITTGRIFCGANSFTVGEAIFDDKVGIGTTSPGANLDVQSVTGTLRLGNNIGSVVTGAVVGKIEFSNVDTSIGAGVQAYIQSRAVDNGANYALDFYTGNKDAVEHIMTLQPSGAIQFNDYDSTNNTGTPTYLLGTDASGNVVKTASSPITSQAASLYDLIPNGAFTTTYAFTSTAGVYAEVMESNDVITSTGTYSVQMFVDDHTVGGTQYDEYYSGVMTWHATSTNDAGVGSTSEIVLHRSGHAGNSGITYLRTRETTSAEGNVLKLEIMCNKTYTGASNVIFKFVKLI